MLLCLPTAPGLPLHGNGDFGTSAFFGQLSDKPAACLYLMMWGTGHKAQWLVEKLNAEHLLGGSAVRQLETGGGRCRKRFEFNWVALAISAPKPFCQFEPGVGTNRRWERARSISIGTEHNMTRGFAEEGSPLGLA